MCEVEINSHGSMVEIDNDDQVGVKVNWLALILMGMKFR